MLDGTVEASVGGESRFLRAGDAAFIPPGVDHSFIAGDGAPLRMVVISNLL